MSCRNVLFSALFTLLHTEEVTGSIPVSPTSKRPGQSLRMGFRPGFFLMFGKGLSNAPKAVMHGRQPALAPRSYPVSTTFPSTARDSSRACAAAASDRGNVESTGTTNRRCATPASRACRSGRGS